MANIERNTPNTVASFGEIIPDATGLLTLNGCMRSCSLSTISLKVYIEPASIQKAKNALNAVTTIVRLVNSSANISAANTTRFLVHWCGLINLINATAFSLVELMGNFF